MAVVADDRSVAQKGEGSDPTAATYLHFAVNVAERLDHCVLTDLRASVDPCVFGIHDRHAVFHKFFLDTAFHDFADDTKLRPAIDAHRFFGPDRGDRDHLVPAADYQRQGVRDVVFVLGVVGLDVRQRREENLVVEQIVTGIDLFDGQLLSCAVAVLDDALDIAAGIPNDPPIASVAADCSASCFSTSVLRVSPRIRGPSPQSTSVSPVKSPRYSLQQLTA